MISLGTRLQCINKISYFLESRYQYSRKVYSPVAAVVDSKNIVDHPCLFKIVTNSMAGIHNLAKDQRLCRP